MMDISDDEAEILGQKDYGSEGKRKREFVLGCIFGSICIVYGTYVFVI